MFAGLVLAASVAAAQQPPPTQQPAVAPPATHVVQQGETLWSLAERYFGDPLLWPEIYRLNTDVVEDPHWIFPGEELRLVPSEEAVAAVTPGAVVTPQDVTVTPSGDTLQPAPPARAADAPTIFSPRLSQPRQQTETVEIQTARAYRAVRDGEYYSAGFLTENQPLVSGRVRGTVQSAAIRRLTTNATASLFSDVVVTSPPGDSLVRGDLLLTYRESGEIAGYGQVIRPTGLLRVTAPWDESSASATVVRMYGQITDGQGVIKVTPFVFPQNVRAEEISDGVQGRVVGLRDPRELVTMQDVIFIDRGADDGVRLGDVFAISGVSGASAGVGAVEQDQARALIVNTRARTSSAVVIELYRPDIRPGATARQVRRMPS
jgi:hypothetical protein